MAQDITQINNQNNTMKMKVLMLFYLVSVACFVGIRAAGQLKTNDNEHLLEEDATFVNGYDLGLPTNGICVGVKSLDSSQSTVIVCLLTLGQTNSHQLWIAPPQFQRVQYSLFDSSHKEVPYRKSYHPANKIFKSISEIPKNVHNVHEGTMWPPFPMPYEETPLIDIFQIEHGGVYELVAKGRILKINDDSSLSLVEFPAVSIPIHVQKSDSTDQP
jgi:hypothetical protein